MPNTAVSFTYAELLAIRIGSSFNRWTVIGAPERYGCYRTPHALSRCECGTEKMVGCRAMLTGVSRSCGCLRTETLNSEQHRAKMRAAPRRRAEPVPKAPPEEGRDTWAGMLDRCHNPQSQSYRHYGGRGIAVCDRWRNSFRDFINDMGLKPTPRHTIDRIDNNGDYDPGNCRWATATQQARNRRKNRMLMVRGETLCLSEWAERAGRSAATVAQRIKRGLSIEEAVFGPLGPNALEHRRRKRDLTD